MFWFGLIVGFLLGVFICFDAIKKASKASDLPFIIRDSMEEIRAIIREGRSNHIEVDGIEYRFRLWPMKRKGLRRPGSGIYMRDPETKRNLSEAMKQLHAQRRQKKERLNGHPAREPGPEQI